MREGRTLPATAAQYGERRWCGGMQAAPWEGMRTHLQQDVLGHAILVVSLARPLVESIARRDRELGRQLRRALSSVPLNLAEAFGTERGNARLRFETARGSLFEAQAGLRTAVAWGYISAEGAADVLGSMHTPGGRVFGLARR
jgi:four helix bundle protein